MAIYRNVQLSFWTDNKVEDDFTPEDKYFYLYLLTNPQTNICGCYEVSYSQLTNQTGYNKDTVNRLLDRFENVHKIIRFNKSTKEILVLNWYKYNWSKSGDTLKGILKVAEHIKSKEFKKYVFDTVENIKNMGVCRPPIDPLEASVSDTDTVIINNKDNDIEKNFNIIYDSYPRKVGRARGFDLYKGWLKGRDISGKKVKLTNKQMWSAIANYKKQLEENGTEKQYIKHFDIFMNKAILDYVEEVVD